MGLGEMLSLDVQDTSMLEVLESSNCNIWSDHKMIKTRLSRFIRYLRETFSLPWLVIMRLLPPRPCLMQKEVALSGEEEEVGMSSHGEKHWWSRSEVFPAAQGSGAVLNIILMWTASP